MMIKYLFLIFVFLCTSDAIAEEEEELLIDGFEISTVADGDNIQQGTLVVDTSLPNFDVLTIPYWFEGDSTLTDLTVSFMGEQLSIIHGLPLSEGIIGYLAVDISNQVLLSGELIYQLISEKEVSLILISEVSLPQDEIIEEQIQVSIEEVEAVEMGSGNFDLIYSVIKSQEDDEVTVSWTQVSGIDNPLNGNKFIVPTEVTTDSTYTYELMVTDGRTSDSKQVSITVLYIAPVVEEQPTELNDSKESGGSSSVLISMLLLLLLSSRFYLIKS